MKRSLLPVSRTSKTNSTSKASSAARASSTRASSTTRPSSTARASSSSRASSSTLLNTPLLIRSKSSLSLKRTPQSTCKGLRNKSADRGRAKKKDVRPIQDKKWQAAMLERIQHYFQQIPESKQLLNKGVNIKPITLNMFVQLTNIVLKNIDSSFVDLALSNYVELLPIHLNTLMYPGYITASTLKTANTMHSWPHILAILSWLVELHELTMMVDVDSYVLVAAPNDSLEVKILKSQLLIILDFFQQWNKGKEIENQDEIIENMYKKFYNFSEDDIENNRKQLNKLYEQLQNTNDLLTADKQSLLTLQEECNLCEDQLKQLEESIEREHQFIKDIDLKISEFKTENENIERTCHKTKNSIEKIEEIITTQPMDIVERSNTLKEIEDLKRQIALIKEKKSHQLRLKDEKDLELSEIKRKVEQVVNDYNIELLRPALNYPELNEIALKQEKLLQPSTAMKEFIKKNTKIKDKLLKDLEPKIITAENILSALKTANENKQQNINLIQSQVEQKKSKQTELNNKYESVLKAREEIEKKKQDEINDLKQELLKLKENNPDTQHKLGELKEANERCEELKNKFHSKHSEMIKFFEQLEEEIRTQQIPRYDRIRNKMTEKVDKYLMQYYVLPDSLKHSADFTKSN